MKMDSAVRKPATISAARIWLYIKEMYPLPTRLGFASLWGAALLLSIKAFSGEPIYGIQIAGTVSLLFFIGLNMRIYDELKDLETDKILFPDRLIPAGKVKLTDLYFLWFLCCVYYVIHAIIFPFPFHLLALIIFALLTYRWFFIPEIISKNLLLAFISHQPLSFLTNIYLLEMISGQHFLYWNSQYWLTVILYALPMAAWEIGRKIRAPHEETAYVTYSKILGSRFATAIVLFTAFFCLALSFYLYLPIWKYRTIFSILTICVVVLPLLPLIRFFFKPLNSSALKNAVNLYILLFLFSQALFLYLS